MNLPSDVNMLVSVVNMNLRDFYETLDDFCAENDIEAEELCSALEIGGFVYDEATNSFKKSEG